MGVAQVLFALAHSYPLALLARALLGLGDALTFVSVLRFAAGQFAPRRYPVVVAITGTLGSIGNVVATAAADRAAARRPAGRRPSWAPALLSLVSGAAVYLMLPRRAAAGRRPGRTGRRAAAALRRVGRRVRTGLVAGRHPGRLLGALHRDEHLADVRGAVGRAVPGAEPGLQPGRRQHRCCWPACWWRCVVGPLIGLPASAATRPPGCRWRSAAAWSPCSAGTRCWPSSRGPMPRGLLVALVLVTGDRWPGVGHRLRAGPRLQRAGHRRHRHRRGERGRLRGRDRGLPGGRAGRWTWPARHRTPAGYRLAFAVAVTVQRSAWCRWCAGGCGPGTGAAGALAAGRADPGAGSSAPAGTCG